MKKLFAHIAMLFVCCALNASEYSVFDGADTVAPTISTNYISITTNDNHSVKLTWEAASDDVTPQSKLKYKAYVAKEKNEVDWWKTIDVEDGKTSVVIDELVPGHTYYFALEVKDEVGNRAYYEKRDYTIAITNYGIVIGGVNLTNVNADEYAKIGIEYNPASNELILSNVNLSTEDNIALAVKDYTTIKLSGLNTLESKNCSALLIDGKPTTITGKGELKVVADVSGGGAISINDTKLTIKDCIVSAQNNYVGSSAASSVWGCKKPSEGGLATLVVEDATLDAKATNNYSGIYRLSALTLKDCNYITPAGAHYDESKTFVVDSKGNRATDVVIRSTINAVESVSADDAYDGKGYTTSGIPVDSSYKGIVIRNSKKYYVK